MEIFGIRCSRVFACDHFILIERDFRTSDSHEWEIRIEYREIREAFDKKRLYNRLFSEDPGYRRKR